MAKDGRGGKTLQDRKLAADVRNLTLREIFKYLTGDDEEFKRELILKLAVTVLPRITEVHDDEGRELPRPILYAVYSNNSNQENHADDEASKGRTGRDISEQDRIDNALPYPSSAVGQDTNANIDSIGIVPTP